jgi:dCTP deaminase
MVAKLGLESCPFCGTRVKDEDVFCSSESCGISLAPRLLVDWEIGLLLKRGELVIDPLFRLKGDEEDEDDNQLGPASIDLRLDTIFKEFKSMNKASIDLREKQREEELYRLIELEMEGGGLYVLHPGDFVIGQSLEYVVFPDYISGRLDGRSSYGRYGVTIHSTAGGVDPGFRGHLAFELSNSGRMPVLLHPTDRVARLSFYLTSKCENPYRGKFQLQVRVKPPVPDPV